jgi:hypothetical protein
MCPGAIGVGLYTVPFKQLPMRKAVNVMVVFFQEPMHE